MQHPQPQHCSSCHSPLAPRQAFLPTQPQHRHTHATSSGRGMPVRCVVQLSALLPTLPCCLPLQYMVTCTATLASGSATAPSAPSMLTTPLDGWAPHCTIVAFHATLASPMAHRAHCCPELAASVCACFLQCCFGAWNEHVCCQAHRIDRRNRLLAAACSGVSIASATATNPTSASFLLSPPASGVIISTYRVTACPTDGGACVTQACITVNCLVDALSPGTTYTATASATSTSSAAALPVSNRVTFTMPLAGGPALTSAQVLSSTTAVVTANHPAGVTYNSVRRAALLCGT